MCSVDIKDVYYSVPIQEDYQKFLKSYTKKELLQFVCFPNGLGPCPRKFTKLFKPPLAELRMLLCMISRYIYDFFSQGDTYNESLHNVIDTIVLFDSLNFVIHPDETSFMPKQVIKILGFVINLVAMVVTLTNEKKDEIKRITKATLSNVITIPNIAECIGKLVASFPAVMEGPLYYRQLEHEKNQKLKLHKGQFDAKIRLTEESKAELLWWHENIDNAFKPIVTGDIDLKVFYDALKLGWGASYADKRTGGVWAASEKWGASYADKRTGGVWAASEKFRLMVVTLTFICSN